MAEDLDKFLAPRAVYNPGAEIFNPANAWPGAPSRIYLEVNPIPGGCYQVGIDPVTQQNWVRLMHYAGGGWSAWATMP